MAPSPPLKPADVAAGRCRAGSVRQSAWSVSGSCFLVRRGEQDEPEPDSPEPRDCPDDICSSSAIMASMLASFAADLLRNGPLPIASAGLQALRARLKTVVGMSPNSPFNILNSSRKAASSQAALSEDTADIFFSKCPALSWVNNGGDFDAEGGPPGTISALFAATTISFAVVPSP